MSSMILNDGGLLQLQRGLCNRFAPHAKALAHSFLGDEELLTVDSLEGALQKAAKALLDHVVLAAKAKLRGLGDQCEDVAQEQSLKGAATSKLGQ